jgi:hypothetical protein
MAHYAFIDKDNVVVNVITGVDENETQADIDGSVVGGSSEAWERFYESLPQFEGLTCKRTSYNTSKNQHINNGTPFRGNYAGIGYKYDPDFNVFVPKQPFSSWKLNYTIFQWEAPIAEPEKIEGYRWIWSEPNKEWIKVAVPTEN